jgi:hypothetical protein
MPKLEHIDDNARVAKTFRPMSPAEMKQMSDSMVEKHKASLDRFFQNHVDA